MQRKYKRHTLNGFSLMELMIAMVIIAVVAAFAVPTYFDQIRKGARGGGMGALLKLQMDQEIWRSEHITYADAIVPLGNSGGIAMSPTVADGRYVLSITSASTYAYVIAATPQGEQAKDTAKGVSCNPLTIDQNNNRSPAACWAK